MKNTLALLFTFLLIGTAVSCKKEGCTDETANNYDAEAKKENGTCTFDPVLLIPVITTVSPYFITDSTAICGGNITSDGGAEILSSGICWSVDPNVTVDDNKLESGTSSYSFDKQMTNLLENTTYYVNSYAINSVGVAYGYEKSFTTVDVIEPTITTIIPTLQTSSIIKTGGNITDNGGGAILARGICWGTSANPTIDDSYAVDNETDLGLITSYVYGAQSEVTYYIRAYAINSAGIGYGQEEVYVNPHISFVGEYYLGGVVFYVNNQGNGLICSMNDQSSAAPWGCQYDTEANDSGIFGGEENTQLILDMCTTPGIAAVLCADYTSNGYSDWFLPSIQDFSQLIGNLTVVNATLSANGGTPISLNSYWTSNESSTNNAFKFDGYSMIVVKTDLNYVRAVRAF